MVKRLGKHLEAFNKGFGVTYNSKDESSLVDNLRKLLLTIPVFSIFVGVKALKDQDLTLRDKKSLKARMILCGLGVGIPIVLALDIIASISTQIHQARAIKAIKATRSQ